MLSKYQWQYTNHLDENVSEDGLGFSQLTARLLHARGITDPTELEQFFNPTLAHLHDPFLLNDMAKAVMRIEQAISNGEVILIYGDYDADGMTSASVLKEALDELGAEVLTYLPNRFTDGYGPNQEVYQYYIENENVNLIITVDNGVAGFEAIEYAMGCSVDVIVTDHHSLPKELPNAFAIIHPEHSSADYPFKHLAGVGVAYKLASALLGEAPIDALDLVAIGTIADMVPLTGENRTLVMLGLAQMKLTEREGLLALLKLSGVDLKDLSEEDVAFQISPRLNALGRLDDPNSAIELLSGFDEGALELAQMFDDKNTERKALVQAMLAEAMAMIDLKDDVHVLAKADWHPGVLGIVAGNIVEATGKPTILLTIQDGIAKGSARSVEALDLFQAMDLHRELFIAFGGHAGAAGMTLAEENISQLKAALEGYVSEQEIDLSQKASLVIDEILELSEISIDLIREINRLSPFGMANPKPVFAISNVRTSLVRAIGANQEHLKLKITDDINELSVIAFNQGKQKDLLGQLKGFDIAGTLSIHSWNAQTNPQLMMNDFAVNGVQILDVRSKTEALPEEADYLIFDEKLKQQFSKVHQVSLKKTAGVDSLVIVDVPSAPDDLASFLVANDYQLIYFKNMIVRPKYLNGVGTRGQFASLFKLIRQYPLIDVRHKLSGMAQFLKIEQELLVDMIKIFEELGFVSIKSGVMQAVESPEKHAIESSKIYQKRKEAVEIESFFALEDVRTIYQKLTENIGEKQE
ncbi:MAG: single-stranded-DNA-specific exonuclease RecJ [Streptococcaceae bacterium]|nr:single-stranded-DNA-specific exonuclease RecJ [Streptococcaceae bacterium]